jgi:endonuclease G, mitochondrial
VVGFILQTLLLLGRVATFSIKFTKKWTVSSIEAEFMPYFLSGGYMAFFYSFVLAFVLTLVTACSTLPLAPSPQSTTSPVPVATKSVAQKSPFKTVVLDHGDFQVVYDPAIRSARYVKYIGLQKHMLEKRAHRKNKFVADPLLKKIGLPYVLPREYSHSGYDQGHLAPAGDFSYSQVANDSTFVMSNMSPQKPKLNRQAWRLLEAQVRRWICGEERVVVITGPIFSDHPEALKDGLSIPVQYFKIVVDDTPPKKAIAFIYNQTDDRVDLKDRIVSIGEVEKKTKIDFSDQLPEEIRPRMRSPSSVSGWRESDCN